MTVIEPVIFEAHISQLAAKDSRWRAVWSEFLASCVMPTTTPTEDSDNNHDNNNNSHDDDNNKSDGATTTTTNNEVSEELFIAQGEPGGFARCLKEPEATKDGVNEWMFKFRKAFRGIAPYPRGTWGASYDGKFSRKNSEKDEKIVDILEGILNGERPRRRGNYYYPPTGYRSWHTNALDTLGWRLFIIHNAPSGSSTFRYRHPIAHEVQDCVDADGTLRLFRITAKPLLWHCVTSNGDRWCTGFEVSDAAAELLRTYMTPITPPKKRSTTPKSVAFLFGTNNGTKKAELDKLQAEAAAAAAGPPATSIRGGHSASSPSSSTTPTSNNPNNQSGRSRSNSFTGFRKHFLSTHFRPPFLSLSSAAVQDDRGDEEEKSDAWLSRSESYEEGKDSAWVRSGEHQSFDNEPDLLPFEELNLSEASSTA